jgi:DNA-binding response OmpR family regulator
MLQDNELLLVPEQPSAKIVLVVAGDERKGASLVQLISQETPYIALLTSTGFAAMKASRLIKPSLFIVEYRLSDMNALQLYDRLNYMKEFQAIPFLMLSDVLPDDTMKQGRIVSMGHPFELDNLLATLDSLLAD